MPSVLLPVAPAKPKSTDVLNREIISASIPALGLQDSVAQALDLMNELHLSQLPVVDSEKYIGLVFEEDLLNMDEQANLASGADRFSRVSAHAGSYFVEAVQTANEYHLGVVPVVEKDGEYAGAVTVADLLYHLGRLTGSSEPGGIIVLELDRRNFSFSQISKLVETNDAQITQLNTWWDPTAELIQVTLKINKFEISDLIATFQRYEYQVKYYFGEELYENELRSNYDHLMNYLNI